MQIYTDYWVTLPQEVRANLAEMFHLNKSGGVEVEDGVVVKDGYTNEDLMAITTEHCQSVLDTTEQNPDVLWPQILVKAGVIMMAGTVEPMPEEPGEKVVKKVRKTKKAKK